MSSVDCVTLTMISKDSYFSYLASKIRQLGDNPSLSSQGGAWANVSGTTEPCVRSRIIGNV